MIKIAIIILIGMLFWAEFTSAQIQHYYKGRHEYELNDAALNNGITVLHDSSYITYGSFEYQSTNERYAAFLRFNSMMQPIDTSFFGFDSTSIEIKQLFEMPNGFLAIGHKLKYGQGFPPFNPYLIRLDNNLDTLWTKTITFGQDTIPFVRQAIFCHDSTIVIGGSVDFDTIFENKKMMFLRIDTLGNKINFKSYGFSNSIDYLSDITETFDNGFALCGSTEFGHPLDYGFCIIFKLDSLGNQQWYRKWGRNDAHNGCISILNLRDSTLLVSSRRPTQADVWPIENRISNLQKITYNNALVWDQDYGTIQNNYYDYLTGISVGVQPSDSTILCIRHRTQGYYPIFSLIDNDGDVIWEREHRLIYGSHLYTRATFVPVDNGFVLSGFLQPCFGCGDTGTQDIFVIKTNCLGFADPPVASATTGSLDNFEVVLENNSQFFGTTYIYWGDGNSDTLYENSDTLIYHTYPSAGNYSATIIAEACGDSDTIQINVVSSLVGVDELEKPKFRIYPNPANEVLFIQTDNSILEYEIILMDISGKIILRKENAKQVDVSEFSNGIYFITIPELNHTEKIQVIR